MLTDNDVNYYINKYNTIDDIYWCTGEYTVIDGNIIKHCALGHCEVGITFSPSTREADNLNILFNEYRLDIVLTNDGKDIRFSQTTPKARILAALEYIKLQQQKTNSNVTQTN